ncbi:MAG: glycosyltransferase family 2 protein [Planctomycetota bacterium]
MMEPSLRSTAKFSAAVSPSHGKQTRVSILFPLFNEAANLPELRRRLCVTLNGIRTATFEIILVDDHSQDETRSLALEWAREDSRVQYIRLSRNFGSHAALSAGLHAAVGDCVIFLSADLQDPPEIIPDLVDRWRRGYRIVWAVRAESPHDRWTARLASKAFWRLMRIGARQSTPPAAADFALLDRSVLDAYQKLTTCNESIIATLCWLGFDQTYVPYHKSVRGRGRSGWTLAKKWKLCIDSIVGFSYWPIRAMSVMGIGYAILGFLFLGYLIWHRLNGYTAVQGWAGLMSATLTGMGVLMFMVGVLGEYVWRVLDEARGRPKYIVEESRKAVIETLDDATTDSPDIVKDATKPIQFVRLSVPSSPTQVCSTTGARP